MHAETARGDGDFQAELERVVATLRRRALIACPRIAAAFGLVTAGPHRRCDGLEVGAGLGIQQPGQPRHPVDALRPQVQTAAAGAIDVAELAVGIEIVGDSPAQLGDHGGIEFGRMPYQRALSVRRGGAGDRTGQGIDRGAHRPDVVLADRARSDRRRQRRQLGVQRRAGQRTARSDAGREREAAPEFSGADAQPRPQHGARHRQRPGLVGRVGDFAEEAVHQPPIGAVLGFESFGDVDPKASADQIRRGPPQHVVGSVDRVERGADALPRLFR